MKTGLGLHKKFRLLIANFNLLRFWFYELCIGFDIANLFIQRVDKVSLKLILKRYGASIGENCDIETGIIFHNCKSYSNLNIGNNCHIGKNCFFDMRDKVIIGDNVVISMQCTFITHIDMIKSSLTKLYPPKQAPIIIENSVYIGAGSQVLKGVKVGRRAFIAAKSLVINDVESNSLLGGVPAKIIKKIDGA